MQLNTRQQKVVESTKPKILCLATAGSGKTRALTERIRYLIEVRKVRPQDIVAFSFTNMAAEEIKKRLGDMANGAYIGTIHGYANRILVSNGFDTINYIQNQLFDKILEKALTISKSKLPKIVHLLIDEAQDLSPLEYHFIERLPTKNIAFFGDELQMIYKFRGSSIAYIEDMFLNTEFEKYYLIEDYRNPPDILSFAQEFTSNCTKFRPKGVAVKKENGYIEKCSFPSALEVLEEDGDWGNWFILTRTNAELAEAQQLLKEREIPNITFKKGDLELSQLEELMLSNNVKLLTIHTSKGLQIPNVIVVGARTYCEEERLIAFVAATRAEEQLFWCPSYKAKSRFKKRSESTCVGQLFKGDQDVVAF